MDRHPSPSLLPIFRSQQQAELLALVLGDANVEHRLVELAERTGVPYASVHREMERAQSAGIVTSRSVGRTRLIRADIASPYFEGLADILVKAFGPPWVLANELAGIERVEGAFIFGSWAARHEGIPGERPVGDIDLLVLGAPDRDAVYAAASAAEQRLGRQVQVTIRAKDWLIAGEGAFHETVTSRPMVPVRLPPRPTSREDH